jgi:hypothetical protein
VSYVRGISVPERETKRVPVRRLALPSEMELHRGKGVLLKNPCPGAGRVNGWRMAQRAVRGATCRMVLESCRIRDPDCAERRKDQDSSFYLALAG